MRISLHLPDSSSEIVDTAREQVEATLARYREAIRDVVVRVRDQNGPRGGVDQRCVVRVALLGAPDVVVREQRAEPLVALSSALKRARRNIGERINARGRRHTSRGQRAARQQRSPDHFRD
ncbi:MAG: hypothetical protein AAF790_05450 [Planctomycetota bacterium]